MPHNTPRPQWDIHPTWDRHSSLWRHTFRCSGILGADRLFSDRLLRKKAASWRKRLGARLPSLGSRVRVSVTPCGFRGGRNGVWVGFSRGFSRFPLPLISFHHFSTLISSISFHFISPYDGASGVVGRHPCYSRTYNMGLHRISSLDPTLCWTRVEDIFTEENVALSER